MSLNFIETLLDKLSPRDSENSLLKNWTGSQNFLGNKISISDRTMYKYQEALLEANDSSLRSHSIKRSPLESTMFPFHHNVSSNSLVSRVSKLFFPAASVLTFHDYSRMNQEINTNQKISVNKVNPLDNLWEEVIQDAFNFAVNITKHNSNNFDYKQRSDSSTKQSITTSDFSDAIATVCASSFVDKVPEMVVEIIGSTPSQQIKNCMKSKIEIPASSSTLVVKDKNLEGSDMGIKTVNNHATVQKNKKIIADNGTLNQELANRKTKELQKRSRNRRRRQKRSNKSKNSNQKNFSSINNNQKPILEKPSVVDLAISQISCDPVNIEKCGHTDSTTPCNVINITDNANSVQIILPNVSSFVIMVDSGDDSDWDENSDSEWLNDASEFECSGLNIANLPSSKSNASLLSVPPHHDEDLETLQLNMLLCRVNKEWNEATKDLDGKSRSSTKVSFVPDDNLVKVLPVEIYERKGEWEIYALERLRFKKRIDELDKIISPCLSKEHREKVIQKYHATDL